MSSLAEVKKKGAIGAATLAGITIGVVAWPHPWDYILDAIGNSLSGSSDLPVQTENQTSIEKSVQYIIDHRSQILTKSSQGFPDLYSLQITIKPVENDTRIALLHTNLRFQNGTTKQAAIFRGGTDINASGILLAIDADTPQAHATIQTLQQGKPVVYMTQGEYLVADQIDQQQIPTGNSYQVFYMDKSQTRESPLKVLGAPTPDLRRSAASITLGIMTNADKIVQTRRGAMGLGARLAALNVLSAIPGKK